MSNVNPLTTNVKVTVCADASDAIKSGYDYRAKDDEYKALELKEIVIVRDGTVAGRPTADFIVQDETGQKFVFMITGGLLRALPLGNLA